MTCKPKRALARLSNTTANEVSSVKAPANMLSGFDIVKSKEETVDLLKYYGEAICTSSGYKSFSDIVEDSSEYRINNTMWDIFQYALSDKIYEIHYLDEDDFSKEIKTQMFVDLFNEFLTNFTQNPLIKMQDGQVLLKAMKTDAGKQYPESSYLYVPDKEKVSTWKLRIYDENGTLDKNLLSAAIASFSAGGYRGNQVQLPEADAKSIKAKLRKIWLETYPDKTKTDMPDGIKKGQEQMNEKIEEIKKSFSSFVEGIFNKNEEIIKELSEEGSQMTEQEKEQLLKSQEAVTSLEKEKEEAITKAKADAEIEVSLAKAEVIAIQKQLDEIKEQEIVKAELAIKADLLKSAQEELTFAKGTPEENAERLFELKKSLGENSELFDFVVDSLKKQASKIEKTLEPQGKDVDETIITKSVAEEVLEELSKIEKEKGVDQTEAFNILRESNPELIEKSLKQ